MHEGKRDRFLSVTYFQTNAKHFGKIKIFFFSSITQNLGALPDYKPKR